MNGSKDLKTIIYFKGVYDTLDLFTDHLIEAFVVSAQIWIRMRMEALAPWQMSCGSPPSGISGGIDGRL